MTSNGMSIEQLTQECVTRARNDDNPLPYQRVVVYLADGVERQRAALEQIALGQNTHSQIAREALRGAHETSQKQWRCFHCDELITSDIDARTHFGSNEHSELERRYTKVLVHAIDGSAAMEAGRAFADSNASPDVEWKVFTALGAACFVLPMAVEDFQ